MPGQGEILVTGISGFIGGHVWARLAGRDDVWGAYGATGSVPLKPERQLQVDLSNTPAIGALVREMKPRCIVHLGALSRPELARRESLLAWRINNAATRELAQAAAQVRARVVFTSSDQVFDGTRGNYREGDDPDPVNVYGETKKAAERAVLSAVEDSSVLRLNIIYGPARFRGSSFSEWIIQRERLGEPIPLFFDQYRTPLDVASAADAIVEMVDHTFRGVLHLGGANRVNRVLFGQLLLKHLGLSTNSILETTAAKHDPEGTMPPDTSFDITLARKVLATPMPNLMEGLERAYGPPRGR
jgi:dTDP-4-dehydrorhamnose reductase